MRCSNPRRCLGSPVRLAALLVRTEAWRPPPLWPSIGTRCGVRSCGVCARPPSQVSSAAAGVVSACSRSWAASAERVACVCPRPRRQLGLFLWSKASLCQHAVMHAQHPPTPLASDNPTQPRQRLGAHSCIEPCVLKACCVLHVLCAAGIVNQFAGLSGLVTMHVGLPSADSFPLSSITASRAHSDQDEELVMIKTHSKVSWPSRGQVGGSMAATRSGCWYKPTPVDVSLHLEAPA